MSNTNIQKNIEKNVTDYNINFDNQGYLYVQKDEGIGKLISNSSKSFLRNLINAVFY